jgi:hypothetical protein
VTFYRIRTRKNRKYEADLKAAAVRVRLYAYASSSSIRRFITISDEQ